MVWNCKSKESPISTLQRHINWRLLLFNCWGGRDSGWVWLLPKCEQSLVIILLVNWRFLNFVVTSFDYLITIIIFTYTVVIVLPDHSMEFIVIHMSVQLPLHPKFGRSETSCYLVRYHTARPQYEIHYIQRGPWSSMQQLTSHWPLRPPHRYYTQILRVFEKQSKPTSLSPLGNFESVISYLPKFFMIA